MYVSKSKCCMYMYVSKSKCCMYMYVSKCKCCMYMYVNERVQLAQWGIALWKMYIIYYHYYYFSPAPLTHTPSAVLTTVIYNVVNKCTASTLEYAGERKQSRNHHHPPKHTNKQNNNNNNKTSFSADWGSFSSHTVSK